MGPDGTFATLLSTDSPKRWPSVAHASPSVGSLCSRLLAIVVCFHSLLSRRSTLVVGHPSARRLRPS